MLFYTADSTEKISFYGEVFKNFKRKLICVRHYYVRLNNEWYRLNFERDFFRDYDVKEERIGETPEEIADTLSQWYQKKEIPIEEIEDLLTMFEKRGMDSDLIRDRLIEKRIPL